MPFWETKSILHCAYNYNQKGSPTKAKVCQVFRKSSQFSKIQKDTTTLYWVFEQLLKLHSYIGGTTDARAKFPITLDTVKELREVNEALDRCCQLALRRTLPCEQFFLKTDAKFQAAGYAVLIEDDSNLKTPHHLKHMFL